MSLDHDIETIYGSYEFSEDEVKQLIKYYTEVHKAMQEQIDYYDEKDADFSKAIKLHDEMSDDCKAFAYELTEYCIGWKYSDQDIVELCEDLIKELKK